MKSPWVTRPSSLVLLTWGSVFALRALPLITFRDLSPQVWQLLLLSGLLYLLGFFGGRSIPLRPSLPKQGPLTASEQRRLVHFVVIFAIIGAAGALLRTYDFLFLRGLDYSSGLGAARLDNIQLVEAAGAGTNYLSAVSRAMIGFSTAAAMIVFLRFELFSWRVARLALLSFAIMLGASALEGGRNTIAVNFVLIFSAALTRKALTKKGVPSSPRLRRALKTMGLLAFALLSYIWIDRLSAVGHESQNATAAIEAVFDIRFNDWINRMEMDGVGNLIFTLIGIVFYYTHGVNEMNWLVTSIGDSHVSLGAYNFDLLALAIQGATGWNIRFDPAMLERAGVYMTGVGELALDYGVTWTPVVLCLIGYLMGSVWRRMKNSNSIASELLNAWGVAGILVSPLYSIIAGFFGVLAVILFFALFFRTTKLHSARDLRPGNAAATAA